MSTSTTTNYGWTIPNDDELVKNGAAAIRTLGQAIDTTAAAQFASGLVHINTTDFSAVASQSLDNVFSATYDNYRILINNATGSTTNNINLRLRVGGSDNSTASSYFRRGAVVSGATLSASQDTQNFLLLTSTLTNPASSSVEVFNPFKTTRTNFNVFSAPQDDIYYSWIGGHNQTVSYSGFSLIASTGNISGSVSVYGYRKS